MRPDAVRHALDAELAAARARRGGEPPRVLDVGGGSGVLAVPFAAAGCAVTVVEPNPNALATLSRRAEDAGVRVTAVQADSDALGQVVPARSADLVLAHGLLEVVDDPKLTVAAMVEALAPGGVVSVLVANRMAALLHGAVAGRLAEAAALAEDPEGRLAGESLLRRYDTEGLLELLTGAGLTVELVQGQSVLTDLVPGSVQSEPGAAEALADLELRVAGLAPLRDIATRLHAVARRS